MALGNILKEAREARGLTTTEVAEHTNMMVQIVEELEKEDFHRIAAPIYGRGFLKLYAELLDIDVQPLIDEFMDMYTGKTAPAIQRMESAPAEIKKPVPIAPPPEEPVQSEAPLPIAPPPEEPVQSEAPQRVEITPRQAVRNIETAPKPLPLQEVQKPAPVAQPSVEVSAPEPVVSAPPVDQPELEVPVAPSVAESDPDADLFNTEAEPPDLSDGIPPEPGDDLFGADEPNLFNTSPLQERIAEARRLMDEKEDAQKDEKKKTSLHLGSNQRLPVFQIGGRMDKTYEAKPRKTRASSVENLPKISLDSLRGFFSKLKIEFPLRLKTGNRSVFVFGALGVIILVFLVSGVMLIFKLTKPATEGESGNATTAAAVAEIVEKPVQPAAMVKGEIPPPPDMYFD